jgi:hypothetical protein
LPDHRAHRGPDPRDPALFHRDAWPRLRAAVAELSWLWTRGYALASSLKLVGDRHDLTDRQRMAVRRSACSDQALERRRRHREPLGGLRGRPLGIDGFNVLTTVEAALGGAFVFHGRDGSLRDLAGVHGTYRKVEETRPAIALVGDYLATLGVGPCLWHLDRPVSNSGRLSALLLELACDRGWDWQVELSFNPDDLLVGAPATVATADAGILDRCGRWTPLARGVVEAAVAGANVVDLAADGTGPQDL